MIRFGVAVLPVCALLLGCSPRGPEGGSFPRLTAQDTDPALGYERPPTLRASELLPPDVVRGPYHGVREDVETDGFFRIYVVDSGFGRFEAAGDVHLRQRVQEIRALATLHALEEGDRYAEAQRAAGRVPFVARWQLAADPVDTIEGLPAEALREVLRVAAIDPDDRTVEESALRHAVLEFEAAKRRLARRLAVNPYAINRLLQQDLNRTGWAVSAGGYPLEEVPSLVETSVAPLAEDLLPAERLERIFGNDSPEDLRRRNWIELAVLGLPAPEIESFLGHPAYSPRWQTGLIEALIALEPARDRGTYVRAATLARTPRDAFFRMMSSFILRFHHLEVTPIDRLLLLNGRTPAAYTREGRLVVAASVDYLLWTRPVDLFVRSLSDADLPDAQISAREVWLSGEASPTSRREIESLGIRLVERVFETMIPRLAAEPG